MIVTPSIAFDSKQVNEFYYSLLSDLDIPAQKIVVSPFAAHGDFTVSNVFPAATSDEYFDIGNRKAGNITAANLATYKGRSVFHGSLLMSTSIIVAGGGTIETANYLCTGPVDSMIHLLYRNRQKAVSAIDVNISSPEAPEGFRDKFDNAIFGLLRKKVNSGAGTCTETTEWLFNGVRIDF